MGSEEAAEETFLPCTQNSNIIYEKHKEIEMFDGSPHFFKVMIGDFAQRLCIPPAFAKKLRSEIGNGRNGVLQGPGGLRWNVKLCSRSTKIEFFGPGWEKFVHHHAIEFGDFLVFKYICRIYFRVRIFGKNGCEKNIPIFHPEKIQTDCDSQKRCPAVPIANASAILTSSGHLMSRKLPVNLKRKLTADAGNEVKKFKPSSHSHPSESSEHFDPSLAEKERQMGKSAETKPKRIRCTRSYYVSSRRPVNDAETKKALQAAFSFVSEKPFGLVIMKPSNVYRMFRLRMSKAFVNSLQLPRERAEVTLVDPNKKEWPVHYLGDLPRASLIGGWRFFSVANNLEEGDVCIFERVDDSKNKIKLNVHIFPVVKECSPYKYIKGEQKNDSLASTTNLYNKKVQDLSKDLATNLPAKAFGPEQGKCVKQRLEQLQGKKEKSSNGSKCINLDKPKCKPYISERKAGCRRSLRLAQACQLAKCPKEELSHHAPFVDQQKSIGRNVVILS